MMLKSDACAVQQRIDDAWHRVTVRNAHIFDELMGRHGLEKTGEDVFERGRKATVYYECNPGSEKYVGRYFKDAKSWLGHQLGNELAFKCARSPFCGGDVGTCMMKASFLVYVWQFIVLYEWSWLPRALKEVWLIPTVPYSLSGRAGRGQSLSLCWTGSHLKHSSCWMA